MILIVYFHKIRIIEVIRLSNQEFSIETLTVFTSGKSTAYKVALDQGVNFR